MATAQRREQWDYWGFIAAWVAKVATGEDIDPAALNPIRQADIERLKTHESKRQDAREMMALIGVALGDKNAVKKWLSTDRVAAEVVEPGVSAPAARSSN